MVSIMTSLWVSTCVRRTRVSVKPHASPVLRAIEYLLGLLGAKYLTTLREFGGLQSYPSRLKDQVGAASRRDRSESVRRRRCGARAPIGTSRAISRCRRGQAGRGVGDAELHQTVWETLVDPNRLLG